MNMHTRTELESIAEGLAGKSVLLTGGTGFVGSLVLEKLLRCCPQVKQVYLLVRSKRGSDPAHRVQKLLQSEIFHPFPKLSGYEQQASKVCAVAADITHPQLGLTPEKLQMLQREVNIIIHSACAIQFDMTVRAALEQIYLPTKALLQISLQCSQLQKFTFISTAYANSNMPAGSTVQEVIYPLEISGAPVDGIQIAEQLCKVSPRKAQLQGTAHMRRWQFQNTYYFVKNLTERLVAQADTTDLSVCIVRPAIIGAIADSPIPGYIGNSSGVTVFMLSYGAGISSHIGHDPHSTLSLIPADVVAANILLATAATRPANGARILHVCTSSTFPLRTYDYVTTVVQYFQDDPVRKGRIASGKHKDMLWVSNSSYKRAAVWKSVKLAMLTAGMRCRGKSRLADKVQKGWSISRDFGSSLYDYDLIYDCGNQKHMIEQTSYRTASPACAGKGGGIKLAFSPAEGDNWKHYVRMYAAGARHKFIRDAPTVDPSHDYDTFFVTAAQQQIAKQLAEKLE